MGEGGKGGGMGQSGGTSGKGRVKNEKVCGGKQGMWSGGGGGEGASKTTTEERGR